MRYFIFVCFFCVFSVSVFGQLERDSLAWNNRYFEDQFYMGLTYNFLLNRPNQVNQRNFSYGLQAGFIRDVPINKDRTIALGIGLGYAVNSYYSNLRALETDEGIDYDILDGDTEFRRSKIGTHLVEMPIEFRWRNSTATNYKFWRVYTGLRLGYVFSGRSKFVSNEDNLSFTNADIRKFQYGITFNFGYNTFNIHLYYALNNLFNDNVLINNENIAMRPMRIGFIFYIL